MSSPLESFNIKHSLRWNILVDIPEWEESSILGWLYGIFVTKDVDFLGSPVNSFNSYIISSIEKRHRLLLPRKVAINTSNWPDMRNSLVKMRTLDSSKFIFFLELVVIYVRDNAQGSVQYGNMKYTPETILNILEKLLENGSKWTIVKKSNSNSGFIERVNSNLTALAESLEINELDDSWAEAFKSTPNPERAIEKAQSAIEFMASKYKMTVATTSVYGKFIGELSDLKSSVFVSVSKPEFDLSNILAGKKSNEVDVNDQYTEWVKVGLNLIQKSNPTRHKSTATTDFKVSPEAGKQAVLIATILCQIIKDGYIKRLVTKKVKKPKNNKT